MKGSPMTNYQDKSRGMLLGLAIGDTLGAPVEFLPGPGSQYIEEMGDKIAHFHDSYRSPKGVWTDDTEMALCIADSLIVNNGYDSYDIMRRFQAWTEEGYRTYDDKPAADVGRQTARAIDEFISHPIVPKNYPKTDSAGNGAIMRLAPIVIANTFPDKNYPTLETAYKKVTDKRDNSGTKNTTGQAAPIRKPVEEAAITQPNVKTDKLKTPSQKFSDEIRQKFKVKNLESNKRLNRILNFHNPNPNPENGHWVTMNGNHIFIEE